VTTSIDGFTHPRTFITKYDRTLALNLRKSRDYPDRDSLLAFGREHCGVHAPEQVIDRIAEALSATLKDQREKIPSKLWASLNTEWQVGL
jgi:serine/threonine-protein kinase HipA